MTDKVRVGVLISGQGSNMQAIAHAATAANCPYNVACVIADRPNAAGLQLANNMNLPAHCIDKKQYSNKLEFERDIDNHLRSHNVQFVALAGFMRILSSWFVDRWQAKLVNIHPSLLPKYKGLHTHERALDAGDPEHGCTIHWVNAGMDEGDIITQATVPVLLDDTEDTLAARVKAAEHKLYPKTLAQLAAQMKP